MASPLTKKFLLTLAALAVVIGAFAGGATLGQSTSFQAWRLERQKADLPESVNLSNINTAAVAETGSTNAATGTNDATENTNAATVGSQPDGNDGTTAETEPLPVTLPAEFNLAVPFSSQAPHGTWDAAHEEYCEEASLLMANRFLTNRTIDGPDDAEAAMDTIADYEVATFGYFESTTAEETAKIARDFLGLEARVVPDFTWEQVKQELVAGNVVILPAAGRELGNPFFTPPGPNYHMLVVKGWTEDKIITNDPGTKRGADYVYDPDVLYAAVGDYNHGNPAAGATVMIVVSN
jgi:hypothetical protein